ncbi:UBX domain-containing protein [Wolffia australiana]
MEDDSGAGVAVFEHKLATFQAITGLEDPDLCAQILAAHDWDLDLAVASFSAAADRRSNGDTAPDRDVIREEGASRPGIAWRLVTLPFYVVSGAVGVGAWVAGTVISRSLGLIGILPSRGSRDGSSSSILPPVSAEAAEAAEFAAMFEREFVGSRVSKPNFVEEGFMDALQRSRREFKMMFVYLHSPDHPDVPEFCSSCLCSDLVADYVNVNFVSWGGSVRGSEGFKMSNSLRALRFPFCAVVMAAANHRIALLQQIEGPKSPEEMLRILQRVYEESSTVLVTARLEAEERRNALRLREEQDAAYRAALEADQARERERRAEQEQLDKEAAEAETRRKEEEEARERAVREANEREAALARRRQEKAMSLGIEPDKGPDVTQVLVRFPTGERRERRFHSSSPVKTLYDFVDSMDCLKVENYKLVSNFPRVSYGPEKHSLTLKEAGLHPHAGLFVELAEP